MSDYTIRVNWLGKDDLPEHEPAKIISGDDFDLEFNAVKSAVDTKADINGDFTQNFFAATPAESTATKQVATTEYVQTELGNYVPDGGITNSAAVYAYKKSTVDLTSTDKPSTDRIWTFDTASFNNNDLGSSWNADIANAGSGAKIYACVAYAVGNTETDTVISSDWTSPQLLSQNGEVGATGGVLVVYADDTDGLNKTLTFGSQEYVLYYEYIGDTPNINDIPASEEWVRFVGVPQSIFPIYATDSSGSNPSFTPTYVSGELTTHYITFFESETQPDLSTVDLSGEVFVRYVGANGLDSTAVGSRGPGRYSLTVTNRASIPSVTGSIFLADALLSITNVLGSGETPVEGDVATITYFYNNVLLGTVNGVYGTGWTAFALEIDGSLLVDGTVDANSINTTNLAVQNVNPINAGSNSFYIKANPGSGEYNIYGATMESTLFETSYILGGTTLVSSYTNASSNATDSITINNTTYLKCDAVIRSAEVSGAGTTYLNILPYSTTNTTKNKRLSKPASEVTFNLVGAIPFYSIHTTTGSNSWHRQKEQFEFNLGQTTSYLSFQADIRRNNDYSEDGADYYVGITDSTTYSGNNVFAFNGDHDTYEDDFIITKIVNKDYGDYNVVGVLTAGFEDDSDVLTFNVNLYLVGHINNPNSNPFIKRTTTNNAMSPTYGFYEGYIQVYN